MFQNQVEFAIVIGTLMLFILSTSLILFYWKYVNSRNLLIKEREHEIFLHKQALITAQLEIKEETLRQVGYELHDNIGQLMTLAKIHANSLHKLHPTEHTLQTINSISKALEELRKLSKSLDSNALKNLSLVNLISQILQQIEKLDAIHCTINVENSEYEIDHGVKIILFRTTQEILTNALKHSKADQICINLKFGEHELILEITDNGIGFDPALMPTVEGNGTGINHIQNRVGIIGAKLHIESYPNKGTKFIITYPTNQHHA